MSNAADIVVERDVVYADGERPLLWNVFRPAAAADGAPVALLLHGGGWRVGHRMAMSDACMAYARHGYVAIAPEYRLLGEAPWPAPLSDARTAIRAVRAQATALRVSPDHIFLTGYSAGAHLALISASGAHAPAGAGEPHADQSEQVAGVAAFFPPARIEAEGAGAMLGVTDPAALAAISPMTHAGRYPPTILFCGDDDTMTPAKLSLDLYQAIRGAGGVADLRLYSNLIHEFVSLPGMMDETIGDAVAFFQRTAIGKPAFDTALGELRKWWETVLARPAQ